MYTNVYVNVLQLSSFVEYTWQCMKLPSVDLTEELAHSELPTIVSAVMVPADSTTQGKVKLDNTLRSGTLIYTCMLNTQMQLVRLRW